MEFSFLVFPYTLEDITRAAVTLDEAGQPILFGVADSPKFFGDSYVAQQHVLSKTNHIVAGPFATNPVTRHFSVHAGIHRSLDEIYPGRSFLGLAAGDSAVHAFGLRPATAEKLYEHAKGFQELAPGIRTLIPAGGLKSMKRAAVACDEVVVAQGFDVGAAEQLSAAAFTAREEAGITRPLKRSLFVLASVWEDESGPDDEERVTFQSMIMSYSRQCMSVTYAGKNVPEEKQDRLRELYSQFSFEQYGDEYNASLLEKYADEKDYVMNRFGVAGTPEHILKTAQAACDATGIDHVWLGLLTPQAPDMLRRCVDRLLPQVPKLSAA
jgi:alkanesulfonate monooxygenase SsuD/methylene tetrahydromethanopterin reductase-like flavin-dependent oxidoreductase (luciferase family)